MEIKNKHKIFFAVLVFGMLFFACSNVFAQEAAATVDNLAASNLTKDLGQTGLLNFLLSFCSAITGLLGLLLNFSISIGKNIINLPIVQTGSQAMINFANLGFVFAIIVMAFATIFRVQGYAMKQILWKLIVAALLVNFSLTIAGAFISVSNIFTDFFLQGLNGKSISDGLMGVLNPQALVQVNDASAWDIVTGLFSYIFKYMASLLFVLVFNFIIILTFFALFIMLLIRVIMLGILLVIMPIIWLLWIFPGTAQYWKQWWDNFIRWTFFAPIVLFFIVLVITSGTQLQNIRNISGLDQGQNAQVQEAFKKSMILNPGFLDHVTQIIITTGLLLGGLFAANKMGITFASTAMGMAKGSGKMFGGWVGRKTTEKTAGALLGSKRMKDWTEKLSGGGTVARLAGMGLNRLGGTVEKYTKKPYEDFAKGLNDDRLNNEILSSNGIIGRGTKRAVLMAEAAKRKEIHEAVQKQLFSDPKSMGQVASEFKTAGLNFGAVEKTLGFSFDMMKAETDVDLENATEKFADSLATKDWSKGQWDDLFKRTDVKAQKIQESLALKIAVKRNEAYAKIVPTLKGATIAGFKKTMQSGINRVVDKDTAKKAQDRLDQTLNRRAEFGDEAWAPGTGTTTTTV